MCFGSKLIIRIRITLQLLYVSRNQTLYIVARDHAKIKRKLLNAEMNKN
jgi:hypothetical protein